MSINKTQEIDVGGAECSEMAPNFYFIWYFKHDIFSRINSRGSNSGVKAPKPSTEKHSRCSWLETGRWSNDRAEKDVLFDCKYNASVSCIHPQIVTAMSLTGLKVGPGKTSKALLSFSVKKEKKDG